MTASSSSADEAKDSVNEVCVTTDPAAVGWSVPLTLEHYGRSLEIYHKANGEKRSSVVETIIQIGNIYYKQRQYDEALTHFGRSLEISRKTKGKDRHFLGIALANMGAIYGHQGRYDEAIDHLGEDEATAALHVHRHALHGVYRLGLTY